MKRSWTASAVALAAIFAVAGCNDYGNTFQNNTGASITLLSPSQISAGSPDFTLTVTGVGFVANTAVQWNGQTIPTKVTTDSAGAVTSVTATVAAALVAKPGDASVNTLNPPSKTSNGLSNTIAFKINPPANPLPALTNMTPNTAPPSTSPSQMLSITLTGTNFLANTDPAQASQVIWSTPGVQTKLAVGTITSTNIPATVTGDLLVNSGSTSLTASVTVFNPPAPPPAGCTFNCSGGGGGGSSTPLTFTICPSSQPNCPPAASPVTAAAAMVAEETPAVSLEGRYVAYTAVQNERAQVFLRDTCEAAAAGCQPRTTLLSVAADSTAGNDDSRTPSISSGGRYVAFSSAATNLVEGAPAGRQIYLRDTCAGAEDSCKPSTQLVSVDADGALVGTESILPSLSSSGRFVAFLAITPSHAAHSFSAPANRAADGNNSGYRQVFIRDTCLGTPNCTPKTLRISLQPGDGKDSHAKPAGPALSGSGRIVAVSSGNAATLFMRSVAVDDRVFLAITGGQR